MGTRAVSVDAYRITIYNGPENVFRKEDPFPMDRIRPDMQEEPSSKPTIRDVAARAEVSISTVSRVMNAPDTVAADKRARVLDAIEQLHYQPNAFARGLISKKSNTIGLMIPDIENPYYAGLI